MGRLQTPDTHRDEDGEGADSVAFFEGLEQQSAQPKPRPLEFFGKEPGLYDHGSKEHLDEVRQAVQEAYDLKGAVGGS